MSASSRTPRHSPHPSLELQGASAYSPQERRHSKSSFHDPSTPLRHSFNPEAMDIGVFGSGALAAGGGGEGEGGGGLGNLADELAGAFSDGEDDDDYYGNEGGAPDISFEAEDDEHAKGGVGDSGVDVESPPGLPVRQQGRGSLSLPSPGPRGHRRAPSEYDGSEYGSESDLDSPGMPPRLVEKIDEVESLARRGTENSPADGAVMRVTEGLRDLGSQSGVEGGASR